MSAKTISSSLTEENRDLRKQIGCMNGIFQLFDRHHFLTGRRISSHNHKRQLQGAQHQLDPQYTKAATEKSLDAQKEKPRISTESSQASYSSSTCSTSTFSSLDCNRIAQPEILSLRQFNIPERPFQATATKEQQPSLTKSMQSLDLRDVVKDSMYREPRCLSIKSPATDERRGNAMKHIDSPRPLQQFKSGKPKATGYEGSTQILGKVQEGVKNSKEEQLALPRFSYDGRESRDTSKWGMRHKELPRLSLDSKTSSMKYSAIQSRLNVQHMENELSSQVIPSNQEPGSHHRSSSVVAKLMGLNMFPDIISSDEKRNPKAALLSQITSTAEENKPNQVNYSPRVLQNNPSSPSPRLHSVRKSSTRSRFPVEPAPWSQHDCSQGSPKMAPQSRKAPTNTPHISSSVYGEIQKRITELEFKKSGKDLRALKQILEAMEKTRERLENERGKSAEFPLQRSCSLEDSCTDQNSNLPMWKNRKSSCQVPLIKGPCTPRQLDSPVVIMKPAKLMDKVNLPVSTRIPTAEISQLQRLQTRDPRYISAHRQKAKDPAQKNNYLKDHIRRLPSSDKKTTWRTSEQDRISAGPQHMMVENCIIPGKSSARTSPRLQQNLLRMEGLSHPTTQLSDSRRIKKQCSKKLIEKASHNRKQKVKAKDRQLSDDQLSEVSSETRYHGDTASVKSESNDSLASQTETEIINLPHSTNTDAGGKVNSVSTTRKHMAAVETVVAMLEQPSPISVLDDTFYCEDSPSPVKKTYTVFRDESPSPGEAEPENSKCSHHGCKYNQKLETKKHSVRELSFWHAEPDETAVHLNASVDKSHHSDHRYITKILLTSGLLKDSCLLSTTDQLLPSCHVINPDMFHVLEQTEDIIASLNGDFSEKNDKMKLDKKIRRKIIFDLVDEILVRKINSGRFAVGKRRTSPQGLLRDVYSEMDHISRMSACNLDNGEDEMTRLLAADIMYQSEDWADYSGECPALVLDVERQIFKDLINEVVTGEFTGLQDWPKRHCRQLFSK